VQSGGVALRSPLRESQLSYGAMASILARSTTEYDIGEHFGPFYWFSSQRRPLERGVAWIGVQTANQIRFGFIWMSTS
jgi:hypothetical protein